MDPIATIRENWRVTLLVVMVAASFYFLFVPGAPIAGPQADAGTTQGGNTTTADTGLTNLQYGIELDGGARIAVPVEGFVASEVEQAADSANHEEIRTAVASAMNLSPAEVNVYDSTGQTASGESVPQNTVEVTAAGNRSAFKQGLENAGIDPDEVQIRTGVTDFTREDIVSVIQDRLSEGGYSGGSVTQDRAGSPRVIVEAPGLTIEELKERLATPGVLEIRLRYPDATNESNYTVQSVLRAEDFEGNPGTIRSNPPRVPVTLTDDGATDFAEALRTAGFTDHPQQCGPAGDGWCIQTVVDGEVVWTGGLGDDLASDIESGTFSENPSYVLETTTSEEAGQLRLYLLTGELPAPLALDQSTDLYISPALAQDFKFNSLVIGILAVLAVVGVVFLRYGDPRVAVPMAAAAVSEVIILLGFAAAIGWSLELSAIAGFIVVVGTGVDDLIIIADEILSQGGARSNRVFNSRFRKAFWVIGAAAATTIVAMSPLAILDLGDLRGFAIITIIGVLIGVAVTRPAYGSILRTLTTEDF